MTCEFLAERDLHAEIYLVVKKKRFSKTQCSILELTKHYMGMYDGAQTVTQSHLYRYQQL